MAPRVAELEAAEAVVVAEEGVAVQLGPALQASHYSTDERATDNSGGNPPISKAREVL